MNVQAFNVITSKNKAKAMTEHISCDTKCKFNSTKCNSKQKWYNKTRHCERRRYNKCKKDFSQNPSRCICENSKYLKSIAATSVTDCDEIVIFMDIVSIKKTNTMATKKRNVTSTTSINCQTKRVRDCCNYDGFQRALASIAQKSFDMKTGQGVSVNKKLAQDLHKPIAKIVKRRKVYPKFRDNISAAALAQMESFSSKHKKVKYFLCAIDIFT